MLRVGIIGWRGMVGSVLLQRMCAERDFDHIEPHFFSNSPESIQGPCIGTETKPVRSAWDIDALKTMSVVLSCQGSEYTQQIHPKLRAAGWMGYWIDAASALRMHENAVIVLDPVNLPLIKDALSRGVKDFIGGNCTVSLMLMGLSGLFLCNEVEWATTMTYQAASGAGAAHMREFVAQMASIGESAQELLADPKTGPLHLDRCISDALAGPKLPKESFGYPLATNLLPWIDTDLGNGQSREEWKGQAEANKILGRSLHPVFIDGICVRVGAMRCHSQALTIKLRRDIPIEEIEEMIAKANPWVRIVPNCREESLAKLTPAAVAGRLTIAVGRLRKLPMGGQYLAAFTVGDQLLWGAAEPLRRMLRILLENMKEDSRSHACDCR